MIGWILLFLILALVAGFFGFGGVAVASAGIAKILFWIFLILLVVSLISGVLELFGLNDFEGAILLIILGAYVIVKPWVDKRQLFGKAEEAKTIEE